VGGLGGQRHLTKKTQNKGEIVDAGICRHICNLAENVPVGGTVDARKLHLAGNRNKTKE